MQLLKHRRGATLVEYGVLAGFIAVLAVSTVAVLGDWVSFNFRVADQELWMAMNEEGNYLDNGDFDDTTGMTEQSFGFASGSLEGWTSDNGRAFELHSSGYEGMSSVNGGFWLDMGESPGPMKISQQIPNLIPGYVYTLTLFAGDRNPAMNNLTYVFWNGVKIGEMKASQPDLMEEFRFHAEAASNSNTLTLMEVAEGPNDNDGMSIDVIRIWGR
ncbi:Flp family type IVb pilin [Loktanella sp. DJP18]|uniref:Flp family type IVb pilin n=1 Tax=Loktanella sp. DJP18 TaxID=3409788 RepID=UPI003BB53BEA